VWANPLNWPAGSLNDVINSDTITGGYVKPNTVFLLQNNGVSDSVFFVTAPITVKGSVTVIGKTNPVTGKPPVVAPYVNTDNSSIGDYFEPQGNDTLTLLALVQMALPIPVVSSTQRETTIRSFLIAVSLKILSVLSKHRTCLIPGHMLILIFISRIVNSGIINMMQ
jgi:hypothetical protein